MRRCAFIEAALSSAHDDRRSGSGALERVSMVLGSVSSAELQSVGFRRQGATVWTPTGGLRWC